MNWLCNPSGRANGFRGVDWLQERNNLFTKVIYGGGGSNHTLSRILEESILIETYRDCHVTVENAFHLEHRTAHHSPADVTQTVQALANEIRRSYAHTFTPGRTAKYNVPDNIEVGLNELQKMPHKRAPNEGFSRSDQMVVEQEDLEVE